MESMPKRTMIKRVQTRRRTQCDWRLPHRPHRHRYLRLCGRETHHGAKHPSCHVSHQSTMSWTHEQIGLKDTHAGTSAKYLPKRTRRMTMTMKRTKPPPHRGESTRIRPMC